MKKYVRPLSLILIPLGGLLLLIGFGADKLTYSIFGVFSATFGIVVYFTANRLIYETGSLSQKTNLALIVLCGSILAFAGINFVVAGEFVPNNTFTGMQLTPLSYIGFLSGSLAGIYLSLLIYEYTFFVGEKTTPRMRKIVVYTSVSAYALLTVVQFPAAVLYAGGYVLMQILFLSIINPIKLYMSI